MYKKYTPNYITQYNNAIYFNKIFKLFTKSMKIVFLVSTVEKHTLTTYTIPTYNIHKFSRNIFKHSQQI